MAEVKKKEKKTKFESESESTSVDEGSSEEEDDKPKNTAVMPPIEKRVIPGALAKPPEQPPWFKHILMEEERPEFTAKFGNTTLANEEVELLDSFMKCREELLPGDLVITDDNLDEDSRDYSRYEVLTKYNEGRYSALYIVAKQTCSDNEETFDKSLYAMKVGLRKESVNTILRFKRELNVLRELRNAGVFHTPCLYDSGRVCDRHYIVMTLFDRNLEKLKECIKGNLRPSTVYYLAGEALEAIEEVHAIGYVHRDIKPTNFCIGINAAAARLYLVDFGEAVKNGKNIRYGVPDAFSLPYWATDSHKKAAANPRVDLEAWFYTFAELQCPKLLSWKRCQVESDVLVAKTKFWTGMLLVGSNRLITNSITFTSTYELEYHLRYCAEILASLEASEAIRSPLTFESHQLSRRDIVLDGFAAKKRSADGSVAVDGQSADLSPVSKPDLESSVAECSPQFIEAAKIIANTHDKADFEALKRLMEDGKTTNLKGALLTLEWVKVMPKELPKRAKPATAPDPNRSISSKSLRSKKAAAPSPKRKQLAESDTSQAAEDWSLSSSLMQKLRLRPKKGKKSFPFGRGSTTSGSCGSSSSVSKKSEKLDPEAKEADETKETLFQRLSLRKRKKLKQAAEAQQSHSAEKNSKYPSSQYATVSGKSIEKNTTPQSKLEPKQKAATTSIIQLLSSPAVKKYDNRKETDSSKAPCSVGSAVVEAAEKGKEGKGEINIDTGKQITSQLHPSKKEETFFQMISRRIRKKKPSASSSAGTEDSPHSSGSAVSCASQTSADGTKSKTDKQELSNAAPAESAGSKQNTSANVKSSTELIYKEKKDLSKSAAANAISVPTTASSVKRTTANNIGAIAASEISKEKPILTETATSKCFEEKAVSNATMTFNDSKEKLTITAASNGSKEKSKTGVTATAMDYSEKAPQQMTVSFTSKTEKSQTKGLLRRLCSLKSEASSSNRQLKNTSSISGTSSETKKSEELKKDAETRSVSVRIKKKAKRIWTKFMKKKDVEYSDDGSRGFAEDDRKN